MGKQLISVSRAQARGSRNALLCRDLMGDLKKVPPPPCAAVSQNGTDLQNNVLSELLISCTNNPVGARPTPGAFKNPMSTAGLRKYELERTDWLCAGLG